MGIEKDTSHIRLRPETAEALEWNKIILWMRQSCVTDGARELIDTETFSSNPLEIKVRVSQTEAARNLNMKDPSFRRRIGLHEVKDPVGHIGHLQKGGILQPSAFIDLKKICTAQLESKNVFAGAYTVTGHQDDMSFDDEVLQPVMELFNPLPDLKKVSQLIGKIIEDWVPQNDQAPENQDGERKNIGRVKDNASRTLASLRGKEKTLISEIEGRLKRIMEKAERSGILQDRWTDIRSGRYVIPIKDEFQKDLEGSVMDTSVTGATVYWEPSEIREGTNRLRRIQMDIETEVQKILNHLSKDILPFCHEIETVYHALVTLDFWIAKGELSKEFNGVSPEILDSPGFILKNAFHPILLKNSSEDDVVKNGISLDDDNLGILLSGPNSGGKTVLLKTVGISFLLYSFGLQIPAEKGSGFYPFKGIWCDLGDNQSIEKNLSTFSARIRNIVNIINEAKNESLVLIDEILAATDPEQASALARSILEHLAEMGVRTIVTTHFDKLKKFALESQLYKNGSMEFDEKSLKPTYRFISGLPGKSMAFQIAQNYGIPLSIVEKAKTLIGKQDEDYGGMIKALEFARKEFEEKSQQLQVQILESEKSKKSYESMKNIFSAEKKDLIIKKSKELDEKMNKILDEASSMNQSPKSLAKKSSELKDKLIDEDDLKEIRKNQEDNLPGIASFNVKDLSTGSLLYSVKFKTNVEYVGQGKAKDLALVQSGSMKMEMPLDDLRLLDKSHTPKKEKIIVERSEMKAYPTTDLDIRGMDLSWAMRELDKQITDALSIGVEGFKIIHGHGEGVLKKAVRDYLKKNPNVAKSRPGAPEEGGDGVTLLMFVS